MYRKLIMTSILVVAFEGSAPQLVGSLLTTFVFILLHLQVNPYLNRGLNHFQRLALITQFITCLSGIIYLMVGCLDDLHEVSPSQPAKDASFLLTIVVFGLNWLTAVLYPAYRYISISPIFLVVVTVCRSDGGNVW